MESPRPASRQERDAGVGQALIHLRNTAASVPITIEPFPPDPSSLWELDAACRQYLAWRDSIPR